MTGKEDIDWDRLDKRKFFGYGAAMFSGATTLLYPLHVIKTRQMALPDISPGFKGTWQTVSGMWTSDGVRGFYRGYATSVFGFLPARMVYLASLEVSKSTVSKLGQKLELSDTVLAGVSNFAGGASASLAVQSIGVPLDVISQRQMVYSGAPVSRTPGGTGSGTAAASPAATAATAAASTTPAAGGTAPIRPTAASTPGIAPSASPTAAAPAAMQPSAVISSTAASPSGTAAAAAQPPPSASASATPSTSAPVKPDTPRPFSTASASASASSTASAKPTGGGSRHISGLQVARTILATEGVRGLYRGFGMSIATVVPSSAVWWAAYGAYQRVIWHALAEAGVGGATAPDSAVPVLDKNTMLVQSSASVAAGLTAGLLTNPLDLIKTRIQVAGQLDGASPTFRLVVGRIIREDGWAGLWRGVLPRMLNSAIWGTAMVGIYETLKRLSKKSPHEMALAAH